MRDLPMYISSLLHNSHGGSSFAFMTTVGLALCLGNLLIACFLISRLMKYMKAQMNNAAAIIIYSNLSETQIRMLHYSDAL